MDLDVSQRFTKFEAPISLGFKRGTLVAGWWREKDLALQPTYFMIMLLVPWHAGSLSNFIALQEDEICDSKCTNVPSKQCIKDLLIDPLLSEIISCSHSAIF